MPEFKIPKIPVNMAMLQKCKSIFDTFFSMRHLEKEFKDAVTIEIFGNSETASAFARHLSGNTVLPYSTDDKEGYARIIASSFSLCVLEVSEVISGSLPRILSFMPKGAKNKVVFCIYDNKDRNLALSTDAYLQSVGFARALWFDKFSSIDRLIIKKLAQKALPAARIYPGIRDALAKKYISVVSRENASLAFVSSLPATLPVVGTLVSMFLSAGDSLVITANQIRLCLRIAGIYGLKLDFFKRMSELLPVVAGSFGWKALAKSAVGLIPGWGAVLKASVAYAGTFVTGIAAQYFYRDGKKLSSEDLKNIFEKGKKEFFKNRFNLKKTDIKR